MSREKEVALYLIHGPPWLGNSAFSDKAKVKAYGAKFNGDAKKWEARSQEDLLSLLRCGLWIPVGFNRSHVALFIQTCVDEVWDSEPVRAAPRTGMMMPFNRRNSDVYKPEEDQETTKSGNTYFYATRCDKCNVLLDSRLQFGLECDCNMAPTWNACHTCLRPTRQTACENCLR